MVKENIHIEGYGEISVEYDKTKYKIMGVDTLKKVVIQRLSDGAIVYISNQCPDYVLQINLENQTHFVIGECDNECVKLNDYTLCDYQNYVELQESFETDSCYIDDIRVGEHTFIVDSDGYSCNLYNLKQLSKRYKRIYNDNRLDFGKNTLLVEDVVDGYSTLTDKIRYLIDVDTYEIVSNIKSEMQQRDIPIYTEEDRKKLKEKLLEEGNFLNPNCNVENVTIYYEIERYLNLIPEKYYKGQDVYNYSKINEEYVRSFKRINQK